MATFFSQKDVLNFISPFVQEVDRKQNKIYCNWHSIGYRLYSKMMMITEWWGTMCLYQWLRECYKQVERGERTVPLIPLYLKREEMGGTWRVPPLSTFGNWPSVPVSVTFILLLQLITGRREREREGGNRYRRSSVNDNYIRSLVDLLPPFTSNDLVGLHCPVCVCARTRV